jgi:hypothetical protein
MRPTTTYTKGKLKPGLIHVNVGGAYVLTRSILPNGDISVFRISVQRYALNPNRSSKKHRKSGGIQVRAAVMKPKNLQDYASYIFDLTPPGAISIFCVSESLSETEFRHAISEASRK